MDEDARLIRAMRAGDDGAIESFVRKYYPGIYRYCLRRLPSSADAEDLTQETFERFFRGFESYRHRGKAKNYLYVIAGSLCADFFRRRGGEQTPELTETVAAPETDTERRLDLESAVRALPEPLREVTVLHYFQDLKLHDIAQILGIGLPLVKYRISKAKQQLKSLLQEDDV
ncbi:MAG: RNA polymerase sigma factor [Butyricicoccus sp.]|nr:RNA polymerase sigma factor [Butyricicoccus sp.]